MPEARHGSDPWGRAPAAPRSPPAQRTGTGRAAHPPGHAGRPSRRCRADARVAGRPRPSPSSCSSSPWSRAGSSASPCSRRRAPTHGRDGRVDRRRRRRVRPAGGDGEPRSATTTAWSPANEAAGWARLGPNLQAPHGRVRGTTRRSGRRSRRCRSSTPRRSTPTRCARRSTSPPRAASAASEVHELGMVQGPDGRWLIDTDESVDAASPRAAATGLSLEAPVAEASGPTTTSSPPPTQAEDSRRRRRPHGHSGGDDHGGDGGHGHDGEDGGDAAAGTTTATTAERAGLHQPAVARPARELVAVGRLGLAQDARHVGLDGLHRDDELGGDLLVRPAAGEQAQDVALAAGELVELGVDDAGRRRGGRRRRRARSPRGAGRTRRRRRARARRRRRARGPRWSW